MNLKMRLFSSHSRMPQAKMSGLVGPVSNYFTEPGTSHPNLEETRNPFDAAGGVRQFFTPQTENVASKGM
jgi:hypothetical protein